MTESRGTLLCAVQESTEPTSGQGAGGLTGVGACPCRRWGWGRRQRLGSGHRRGEGAAQRLVLMLNDSLCVEP